MCGRHGSLCGIEVGFFLKLANILLVPDSFVAKPVGYLQIAQTEVKGKRGQPSSNNHWTPRGHLGKHSVLNLDHGFQGSLLLSANLDTQNNTTSWS